MDFCAPGTFGDDCNSLCHCRNGPCDYVTGECTGGCQQNWTGIACSECVSDHYGPLCEKSCSSRHCDESSAYSSCSRVTGRCDNGCTAGWMEKDCTEICASGTFGDDCTSFCHCLDGPCDYITGECTGECKQNWTGITCSECDSDLYGPLCAKPCSSRHCDESSANSSCSKVTGRCDNGCTAGWLEQDCTTSKIYTKIA
ncbi:multiple epidermal growth factor-like domains protein 10 [Gigantopelta aegis]|uniref:multiple epidermal growth factor-like domains protein 10 n=1 Tax=Gigantopelta aegis TaxID=1735272 RepID=UPI001B88774B|nr:multiple epidermal growth factor-like domains protein 10 [Gigantopelta aegis]